MSPDKPSREKSQPPRALAPWKKYLLVGFAALGVTGLAVHAYQRLTHRPAEKQDKPEPRVSPGSGLGARGLVSSPAPSDEGPAGGADRG